MRGMTAPAPSAPVPSTDSPADDGLLAADCPLCGAEERRLVHHAALDVNLGHAGRFDIVECARCAVRYIDPRPVGAMLAAYYAGTDKSAYPNHQVGSDLALPPPGARHVLHAEQGWPAPDGPAPSSAELAVARAWLQHDDRRHRIPPWVGQGRLLDVGCGTGSYLASMAALGLSVTGVDLFEDVAREVSARYGIPVHAGELPAVDLPPGSFDIVTLWHMVEHLPNPGQVIARARELLAPGGVLMLGVPVYDCDEEALLGAAWLGYDVPRHLLTFSRARLKSFLTELGLAVEWMASEPAAWILRRGARTVRLPFVQRQLLGHRVTREWIARRQAARNRSGKVVVLARRTD